MIRPAPRDSRGRIIDPWLVRVSCGHCRKIFKTRSTAKYCSRSCAASATVLRGSENPNWKGGITRNASDYAKSQKEKFPEKYFARKITHRAIRKGDLVPKPCENCGDEVVDAHHDDYAKPLEVRWLCRKHHALLHPKTPLRAAFCGLHGGPQ